MPARYCAACGRYLSRDCYSNSEWSKGDGGSRCAGCTHQGGGDNSSASQHHRAVLLDPSQTARCNISGDALFSDDALRNPFASGSFRWVAKGSYTSGTRRGEACVCKWFKTGGVMETQFFDTDIGACQEAVRLVTEWNAEQLVKRLIKINLPEVWTFVQDGSEWAGRKVLQEPFIENYQKFNSNTGWKDDSIPWARVMQALSHFTYHVSNGQRLLCDLQGGVYQDGVVLTDPVVLSVNREYGPTDLGPDGIANFFAHHQCNEFCRSEWRKPHCTRHYYRLTAGTTMEQHVLPTQHSRQPMTSAHRQY